ncbi:GDP-fucose protein O-fucosyltransferase 2 [Cimex lectularius]|uniref:GDP-fucose protein O-fucosyltransferase 2 n=1 Tax=Cimex lectularius TaxID=79782 RepID=A0A8I6TF47_CIMLE|nr:GDP-fucose protein O-fucosyltransferase 2 [Cimex lectularius]XP_014245556.1 GDP-fucose protein O-fucosyltransferase 2 [Cimex lectularius]
MVLSSVERICLGKMTLSVLVALFLVFLDVYRCDEGVCKIDKKDDCSDGISRVNFRYVLYNVNPSEGFNLRRDVYMRLAIFLKNLNQNSKDYWYLVLPPWNHLYHWRSKMIGEQNFLPWSQFFDLDSMRRFVPVIETKEFMDDVLEGDALDSVYYLQHFKDAFSKNWTWEDKWTFEECREPHSWEYKETEGVSVGTLWGYKNLKAKEVKCISFQGGASLLKEILAVSKSRYSVFQRSEIMLHDNFGDKTYWQCRMSMKFARPLVDEAAAFMKLNFQMDDLFDVVKLRNHGRNQDRTKINAGSYLCVHLRRRDFLHGRSAEVPSLEYAAEQIQDKLQEQNLTVVFVSTDAPDDEVLILKQLLKSVTVIQYKADDKKQKRFKDGGIAIIDQIICSYAKYFIGTHESTFSFRIQEEREILGFPPEMTFNRLCGADKTCTAPSKWTIEL